MCGRPMLHNEGLMDEELHSYNFQVLREQRVFPWAWGWNGDRASRCASGVFRGARGWLSVAEMRTASGAY